MLSFKSIGGSMFELESGDQNVDGQTDGHKNRWVGYIKPPQNMVIIKITPGQVSD